MPSSVYSNKSGGSRGSKRVNTKKSEVDETLFGNKKNNSQTVTQNPEEVKRLTEEIRKGELTNPNAVVLPQSELLRMKNLAVIMTKEEQLQQKKIQEEQNEKQMAAAKAKKQKMMEIEAERKKEVPPTESELAEKMKSDTLLSRAEEILNEQRDEVKHMNQLILYAKVATIRDRQLEEKKDVVVHRKIEEKRKDLMMEVDRLKKIKYYEEIEKEKKEELRKGHLVIIDQIKDRELERLKAQEEKEREGQEMIKHIRQLQKEEGINNVKRKQKQKELLDEIYDANHRAISDKQKKILEEKAEEEKIIKYNIEKAQKDAEYLAEQQRIKEEKEREVTRLRALQEKAQDRQSEIDALRAKRAFEQADRLAREKERKEAENRARINQELFDARKLQSMEKELRLQEQARQDRDEFQRIIQTQKLERDLELKVEQEKKQLVKDHAQELKKQIALHEEKLLQDKRTHLEEGKKIKDKLSSEQRTLNRLKEQKMSELESAGVNEKYMSDLARKKIVV